MLLKEGGALDWQVLNQGQLIQQPLVPFSSKGPIPHQALCCELMQLPLVVMHQTLDPVPCSSNLDSFIVHSCSGDDYKRPFRVA